MRTTVRFALCLAMSLAALPAFGKPSEAVLDAEAQRIAAMEKAKKAVLAIFMSNGQGGGSGVVISPDGYALTNFHVAQPCGSYMQCGMADGKAYDAVLVGLDPTGDVALIKLFGRDDFPTAELGNSDRLRVGDWVFAMGNPFLLATDFQPTTTYGIVSGVHRYQPPSDTLLEYADCIQTDAAVNPGNSGGPLFDAEGRLIGINGRCSFEKRGRVNVGVAYAISINQIKNFLGVLRSGRIVDHATLGATVDWDDAGRVVVNEILESSDAYRRGLRYDDEIVSFGGRPISSPNGLKNVLGIYPKGWRVALGYRHEGKRHDVLVRLAGVHTEGELIEKLGGRQRQKPPDAPKPKPKAKPSKTPGDQPKRTPQDVPPVPEIVTKHFQEKPGFANHYFNTINQRRLWDAWIAGAKLADAAGPWTISGSLATGKPFGLEITGKGALLKVPSGDIDWTAGDELGTSPLPANSGGLLPALYLWRRLATEGLARFGNVFYYGTTPLPGHAGVADVLVGSHKGVECWFYFDPIDGRMLALEMFAAEDWDPCQIAFSDYRPLGGRLAPGQMEVRYGNETFAVFKIDKFNAPKQGRTAK
ncbi:MAG: trypsin-like peptidase domain-containing protein [Thermoguttaceae bacterium]